MKRFGEKTRFKQGLNQIIVDENNCMQKQLDSVLVLNENM